MKICGFLPSILLLTGQIALAAPPFGTSNTTDLRVISGLSKPPPAQACAAPKKGKTGEATPPPARAPVIRRPVNPDPLSCYDGVDYGTPHEMDVAFKDGKEQKTVHGTVHTDAYIPHEGAINTYFMKHDHWDLANSLGNSPVEAFGTYQEIPNPIPEKLPKLANLKFVGGKISSFGGKGDSGMKDDEPVVCGGLGHNLNPTRDRYCAFRADLTVRFKKDWCNTEFVVRSPKTGKTTTCQWNEWGPNRKTKRMFDASNRVLQDLGIDTDDQVQIAFAKPNCTGRYLDLSEPSTQ